MEAYEFGYGVGRGIGELLRVVIAYWFLFCVVPAILPATVAWYKGRSALGFFLLSMLLTPLIGLVAALIAAPCQNREEVFMLRTGRSRKCPFCAEIIKQEATICRYCGREVGVSKEEDNGNGGT